MTFEETWHENFPEFGHDDNVRKEIMSNPYCHMLFSKYIELKRDNLDKRKEGEEIEEDS